METSADRYVLVLHSVDEVACRRWTDRHDRGDDSGQQGDSSLTIAELVALFCTGGKSAFWWVRAMETPIVQWKGSCVQWKGRGMQWKGFPGAMESWFSQQLLPPQLSGRFLLYLIMPKRTLSSKIRSTDWFMRFMVNLPSTMACLKAAMTPATRLGV